MPPAPRPSPSVAARRLRRAPVAVAVVGLLSLGGAVAGGYGTGLVLGTRIAPRPEALVAEPSSHPDDPARPPGGGSDPVGDRSPAAEVPTSSTPVTATTSPRRQPSPSPAPTDASPIPQPPGDGGPVPTVPPPPPASLPPPTDPVAATRQLAGAAAGGDVDEVWEMLTPPARAALGDRRALATRLTDLHDRLAPVRDGARLAVTVLLTERGAVTVVAPVVASGTTPLALPFVEVDGRPRLAAIEPPPGVRWVAPVDGDTDLVVAGARPPAEVGVDGAGVEAVPAGSGAVRVAVDALPDGPHRAVAVFLDGNQVAASAFEFSIARLTLDGPDGPAAPAPEAAA